MVNVCLLDGGRRETSNIVQESLLEELAASINWLVRPDKSDITFIEICN